MQSLRELFRYGMGPSSSHTMGPRRAAERFRDQYPQASAVRVTLYGSLSLTGRGHLTDRAIIEGLHPLTKARRLRGAEQRTGLLSAYALAVSETNAAGGFVVTAPTCGACGVLPAVLYHLRRALRQDEGGMLRALATAGLVGNVVKQNASISGAEVGCQGEVGVACAMAAAAAAQLLGGTPHQIEYAAEIGLEHHLGLTCDPILGLVQVPCIERNVFAAIKALASAEYALLSDGRHLVSFDQVVEVMKQTGHDLPSLYRETSLGGLARLFNPAREPA